MMCVIDAMDFISMLAECESIDTDIQIPFGRINRLREALLSENLPHDLGFYDFEEVEETYPDNIEVMCEYVHIKMSANFVRVINRRKLISKSVGHVKMMEIWKS